MAKSPAAKKPVASQKPTVPAPFKPRRLVFDDATGGYFGLSIGTEKLGDPGGSLSIPDSARGKVALCFGSSEDDSEFNCDGHLHLGQVDRLIAFLQEVRSEITLTAACAGDGDMDFERVR